MEAIWRYNKGTNGSLRLARTQPKNRIGPRSPSWSHLAVPVTLCDAGVATRRRAGLEERLVPEVA